MHTEAVKNISSSLFAATLQARPNTISQTSLQQQQDQQQPGMVIIPELPHNPGHGHHHMPRFK